MGYRTVALSSGPDKEELARRLGADEYVDGSKADQTDTLRKMGGAKLIMCTATAPEATKRLIKGLDVDGTLLLLAVDNQEFGVSPRMCPFVTIPFLHISHPTPPRVSGTRSAAIFDSRPAERNSARYRRLHRVCKAA